MALNLKRSKTNKRIGGVCYGVAEKLGIQADSLRLALLALNLGPFFLIPFAPFLGELMREAGGLSAIVYLVLWATLPEE